MSAGLHALVLAAGLGRRFGGAKLLAPWGGGVLLDGALAAAFAAPAGAVIVVTGAQAGLVETAARAFAAPRPDADRLRIVQSPAYADGMAQSLRAGVTALAPEADGVFLFLGDMPRPPHSVLPLLASALAEGAAAAAPVFAGRLGHPVLFSAALFPALLELQGDRGARGVLDRLGPGLARVESPDDGVLFDVDTQADLTAATIRRRQG